MVVGSNFRNQMFRVLRSQDKEIFLRTTEGSEFVGLNNGKAEMKPNSFLQLMPGGGIHIPGMAFFRPESPCVTHLSMGYPDGTCVPFVAIQNVVVLDPSNWFHLKWDGPQKRKEYGIYYPFPGDMRRCI